MVENKWGNKNIEIVMNYFANNFREFKLDNVFNHGPFWGMQYSDNETKVIINGDIGFNIIIEIGSKKFNLWEFDRSVNQAMKTTEENILYQLNILSNFFKIK